MQATKLAVIPRMGSVLLSRNYITQYDVNFSHNLLIVFTYHNQAGCHSDVIVPK